MCWHGHPNCQKTCHLSPRVFSMTSGGRKHRVNWLTQAEKWPSNGGRPHSFVSHQLAAKRRNTAAVTLLLGASRCTNTEYDMIRYICMHDSGVDLCWKVVDFVSSLSRFCQVYRKWCERFRHVTLLAASSVFSSSTGQCCSSTLPCTAHRCNGSWRCLQDMFDSAYNSIINIVSCAAKALCYIHCVKFLHWSHPS